MRLLQKALLCDGADKRCGGRLGVDVVADKDDNDDDDDDDDDDEPWGAQMVGAAVRRGSRTDAGAAPSKAIL